MKRFCLPSHTRGSRKIGHKFETCHNKTRTHYRGPRTGPCHNQNLFENGIRLLYRKQCHKYLSIAMLNYNTTYHSSIDCEPSRVFLGRVPHNILDHKLGLRFNPNIAPTTDFAEELLPRTKNLYYKTKKNFMQSLSNTRSITTK